MVESHRRVERRGIVGTGMATDPERIREIEQRAARMERDYKLPHKKFGEVMDGPHTAGAPANTEWVDAPQEKQRRARPGTPTPPASNKDGETPAPVPNADGSTAPAAPQAPAAASAADAPQPPPAPGPRTRPMTGAANANVGSTLGGRARVAFKV